MSAPADLRLSGLKIERSGAPLGFSFDGEPLRGLAGESVAAALTAAGHLDLRQAGPGDRRGVFCGMGACQECLVEIDGRGAQRACMTTLSADMTVRRHDPATARLAPLAPRAAADPPEEETTVAIVGAGPAGLSCAIALAESGLTPIVIDERPHSGGQFFKPLAPSHRFLPGGEDRQFAAGREIVGRAQALNVDIRNGHMVWQANALPGKPVSLGIIVGDRSYVLEAKAVVVATGAYERPLHVPGWTLPGVMTAGAAQTLARTYRVAPGRRVLVAGNGPLNWQVALEIAENGGNVVGLLESAQPFRPRNAGGAVAMLLADPALTLAGIGMWARLRRAGIVLHTGYRIDALHGSGRVTSASAKSDDHRPPMEIEADAVVLGYGFTPSVELTRLLGVSMRVDTGGFPIPVIDADGKAEGRRVWVAGDGNSMGGSAAALAQGQVAANSILAALGRASSGAVPARRELERAQSFQKGLWSVFAASPVQDRDQFPETVLCRCEGVTSGSVAALRDEGVRDLGSLKRRLRLGMGRCQGRYCTAAALRILSGNDSPPTDESALFAPQPPARPIAALALATEKPEWGGHREVEGLPSKTVAVGPDALATGCDLLVIGAGIIGTSTAMYAARAGIDTVVIDRLPPNSEASGSNAGSLHVQLLSWDFGLKAMAGGSPALNTLPLQREAVALWKNLESELGGNFELVNTGGLMVAESADQAQFLQRKAKAEAEAGIDVEILGRSELAALSPAISEQMVVAAYCAAEGKINPLKATPAIVAEAQRNGARFSGGHEVTSIARSASGFVVTTVAASIRARRIVIASGGWSRHVGRHVGVELPIQGAPLQMLVTEPARPILKQLVAHADRHLTMKQASDGNFIIGGAWPASTDEETGHARVLRRSIEGNLWVAERTLPIIGGLHLIRSWAAMNVNIDGAPLLGEIPGAPGVFIAASANGYTLGPLLGMFTADMVQGRSRPDLAFFTLQRFR